jgi:hypothetical protein
MAAQLPVQASAPVKLQSREQRVVELRPLSTHLHSLLEPLLATLLHLLSEWYGGSLSAYAAVQGWLQLTASVSTDRKKQLSESSMQAGDQRANDAPHLVPATFMPMEKAGAPSLDWAGLAGDPFPSFSFRSIPHCVHHCLGR